MSITGPAPSLLAVTFLLSRFRCRLFRFDSFFASPPWAMSLGSCLPDFFGAAGEAIELLWYRCMGAGHSILNYLKSCAAI